MLSLENISLTFGNGYLLDNISTVINNDERVGLVGANGAGKSTLLKIIAGRLEATDGAINASNEATIGYLPQDGVSPDPGHTLFEEMESVFDDIRELDEKVQQLRHELGDVSPNSSLHDQKMNQLGNLQTQLEQSGAYTIEADIAKILMGLGFEEEDFSRSTTEFSGGWLMRIALGKLLLQRPMYLLLDEPTNHLDIDSLQWIEDFLRRYDGAVIMVSHDKAFLDTITNRTLALKQGDLLDYAGNYSYYKEKDAERREHLQKAYENQQREIKQLEDFISKFRYNASKASQVQSRVKKLEKMDKIQLDEREQEISFDFPPPARSGAVVMKLKNITKKYDDNIVFENLDYDINRGENIAIVGPNGAGKSTLIRLLAGLEAFQNGDREIGHNVTVSYFAQHQAEELDLSKSIFEIMRQAAPKATKTRLRTLLGCFLFQGEEVFKKVSVLSGGEKSRLALARMLVQPANFLIFDEPTNHLDMQSKKILQQALQQYEGTYIIVSHDQDFLDPIVEKIFEVHHHETRTYLGNISYYLEKKQESKKRDAKSKERKVEKQEAKKLKGKASSASKNGLSRKEQRQIEAQQRQRKYNKLKPLKKRVTPLENDITRLEGRKDEIEVLMAQPDFYDDEEEVKEISMKYEKLKAELVESYAEWEELAEKIAAIENEFS